MGHSWLKRPLESLPEVQKIRDIGTLKGVSTGMRGLDKLYTAKKGYPLFVAGAPHHGKSVFVKQLVVNFAITKGWRSLLYMGEEGSASDLVCDLIEMYVKKDIRKLREGGWPNPQAMTDEEFMNALKWIDRHFRVICPDEIGAHPAPFSMADFQKLATEEPFDVTVLDPYNDLDSDINLHGGREDLQLADVLKSVRVECRKHNRVDIVVTHIAKINADKRTKEGKRYLSPAMPSEWAGGQTWFRRAFTMLLVYRPPEGYIIDGSGEPIEKGEGWIFCQKSKPKGVGSLGRCKLYWTPEIHTFVDKENEAQEGGESPF